MANRAEQDACPHEFGPVQIARLTGNPHRRCLLCRFITLDLEDEEEEKVESSIRYQLQLDFKGFVVALADIADDEINRRIISDEMKEWWGELRSILHVCPYHALPQDD